MNMQNTITKLKDHLQNSCSYTNKNNYYLIFSIMI